MRLIVLTVMGLIAGLGLAAAIVSVPVMADKGPLRTTLVAHLAGAQEVPGGGDPDGQGRAVVKVFGEQLCARVETDGIETLSKATIHLGMSGENGPIVANLEERAATPTVGTTTSTTGTTGTTTGTTAGTTTPTTGTTTATTGTTGAQTGTTTTGDTTLPQATTPQTTTMDQTSPSQSTAAPTASVSAASVSAASASADSASAATILEHTGVCVAVPGALSLELREHPPRFYVNVTNGQYPEGAIRGQLHRSGDDGNDDHDDNGNDDRDGNDDHDGNGNRDDNNGNER